MCQHPHNTTSPIEISGSVALIAKYYVRNRKNFPCLNS